MENMPNNLPRPAPIPATFEGWMKFLHDNGYGIPPEAEADPTAFSDTATTAAAAADSWTTFLEDLPELGWAAKAAMAATKAIKYAAAKAKAAKEAMENNPTATAAAAGMAGLAGAAAASMFNKPKQAEPTDAKSQIPKPTPPWTSPAILDPRSQIPHLTS